MLSKSQKELMFKDYQTIFNSSSIGILLEMKGMKVEDMTILRQKLLKDKSRLKVLKNRVAIKAAQGTPFEQLSDQLKEVKVLVYNETDPVAPARLLVKELKSNERMNIISGIMISGSRADLISVNDVVTLGNLPSREELIAKILFLLNAPITNFVRTLNEIPSSFVRVLNAISENKNQ